MPDPVLQAEGPQVLIERMAGHLSFAERESCTLASLGRGNGALFYS